MDTLLIILGFFALIITWVLGWLFGKFQAQRRANRLTQQASEHLHEVQQQLSRSQAQSELYQRQYEQAQQQLQQKEEKIQQLIAENNRIHEAYNQLQQKLAEQKEEIQQIRQQFERDFENLANRIFEEKSQKFTEQNNIRIGEILNPLKEKIGEFEKKVDEVNKENIRHHSELKSQLTLLQQLNQQISQEANNLTKALKGDSKARGRWGELILEKILELSGLEKDREYLLQESYADINGKRLQPDVVVKLPENKFLIIDAKVSLVAYERYTSSDDPNEQERALREHVQSVRNHIDGLEKRNYAQIHGVNSPDFVFLFMPIEAAYALALKADPNLYEYAFLKQVILVAPFNLLTTLRIVANIWRQEKQQRNVQQIAEEAKKMLDKFYLLCQRLEEVGNRIHQAQVAYDDTMKTLSTGRGNLMSMAKRIVHLGVSPSKQLPSGFAQIADQNNTDDDE
ncbi:MAG: DNA recombination protein RmuC [Thermoflavifilum sp.]|nr:DNA recombination protein RmuC [Thermoflavifilum sp.]